MIWESSVQCRPTRRHAESAFITLQRRSILGTRIILDEYNILNNVPANCVIKRNHKQTLKFARFVRYLGSGSEPKTLVSEPLSQRSWLVLQLVSLLFAPVSSLVWQLCASSSSQLSSPSGPVFSCVLSTSFSSYVVVVVSASDVLCAASASVSFVVSSVVWIEAQ